MDSGMQNLFIIVFIVVVLAFGGVYFLTNTGSPGNSTVTVTATPAPSINATPLPTITPRPATPTPVPSAEGSLDDYYAWLASRNATPTPSTPAYNNSVFIPGQGWIGVVTVTPNPTPDNRPPEHTPIANEEYFTTMATMFIKSKPTFAYDGVPGSLKVQPLMYITNGTVDVTAEFDCVHNGYGDRSKVKMDYQVTHHTAALMLMNRSGNWIVQSYLIDWQWDEIAQKAVNVTVT